ncbi:MAG: polymer-forming cytoskeletal protein [Oscillospiraceae bacterium]
MAAKKGLLQMRQGQRIYMGGTTRSAKTTLRELAAMVGLGSETPKELKMQAGSSFDTDYEVAEVIIPAEPPVEASIIANGVVLEGNICTEGGLDFRGTINGDLIAGGFITSSGKQKGNLDGQQIHLAGARIEGNVIAREHVDIDRNSKVIGNVQGKSIVLDGQIDGQLRAEGLVCLRKNAILNGDIQAGSLSIEEGARVTGQIVMKLA